MFGPPKKRAPLVSASRTASSRSSVASRSTSHSSVLSNDSITYESRIIESEVRVRRSIPDNARPRSSVESTESGRFTRDPPTRLKVIEQSSTYIYTPEVVHLAPSEDVRQRRENIRASISETKPATIEKLPDPATVEEIGPLSESEDDESSSSSSEDTNPLPIHMDIFGYPEDGTVLQAVVAFADKAKSMKPLPTPRELQEHNRILHYPAGYFLWYRDHIRVQQGPHCDTYTVDERDVGHYVSCQYVSNQEEAIIPAVVVGPIMEKRPKINSLNVIGSPTIGSTLVLTGTTDGCTFDNSCVEWWRITALGHRQMICQVRSLTLTKEERDCEIEVRVTPISTAGLTGESFVKVLGPVRCSVPTVRLFTIKGDAADGCHISACCIREGSYIEDADDDRVRQVQWYVDGQPIPDANTSVYIVQRRDVGHQLSCVYVPLAENNPLLMGQPVTAHTGIVENSAMVLQTEMTDPVHVGKPIVLKIMTTAQLVIDWSMSMFRDVWQPLPHLKGRRGFTPNTDMLRSFVRVRVTPISSFGIRGPQAVQERRVGLSTKLSRDILHSLTMGRQAIEVNEATETLILDGQGFSVVKDELKFIHGKWTQHSELKFVSGSDTDVTVHAGSKEHRLSLGNERQREVVTLLFRAFHAAHTLEIMNALFGPGYQKALAKEGYDIIDESNLSLGAKNMFSSLDNERIESNGLQATLGTPRIMARNVMLALLNPQYRSQ